MTINGTTISTSGGNNISSSINNIIEEAKNTISSDATTPTTTTIKNDVVANVPIYTQGYTTTTTLLIVVHVLFLYHWWNRRSRKRLLVSYKVLVQKKHFHKALFFAILSHPPTRPSNSSNNSINNNYNNGLQYLAQFIPTFLRDYYNSSALMNGRHLSGLPLLFYNSYILWTCRALEGMFHQEFPTITIPYARTLWGLSLVGFALDLGFTGYILQLVRNINYGTSTSTPPSTTRPEVIQQVELFLCHRTLGGLTLTSSAALAVFHFHYFPFVPIQFFPLLPTWLPILSIPSVSYGLSIITLLILNHSTHPIASVVFGTLSGLFWSWNITSFLVEPYWSNGTILTYLFLCGLSLRATSSPLVPCIDYVSWDDQGRRIRSDNDSAVFFEREADVFVHHNDQDDETSNHSLEEEDDAENDEELELPLLHSDTQDFRHRLPVMNDMEENDNDGNADDDTFQGATTFYSSNNSRRPTSNTMRSRRMRS